MRHPQANAQRVDTTGCFTACGAPYARPGAERQYVAGNDGTADGSATARQCTARRIVIGLAE